MPNKSTAHSCDGAWRFGFVNVMQAVVAEELSGAAAALG